MKIKKFNFKIGLFLLIIICSNLSSGSYDLEFQSIKENVWCGPLKSSFLKKMAELFEVDIFIETGTWRGDTLNNAKNYFKQLYSVEKRKTTYLETVKRFRNKNSIYLFCDDSPNFLSKILPTIDERIIFWLDAHDSIDSTAILQEIEEIKKHCTKLPIILVDDIVDFARSNSYPSVQKLKNAILSIDKDYQFVLLFDAALAFPAQMEVTISPVLKACTESYLFQESGEKKRSKIIEAEKTIALCQGKEKDLILQLHQLPKSYYTKVGVYHLWAGLTFLESEQYYQAKNFFYKAMKYGCCHLKGELYANF